MKITFILLLAFLRDGVFGESVSVMEGDSVTLNTDITDLQTDDVVVWKFGPQENEIAKLNKALKDIISYNDVDERFTRRLQLNQQTGSLTIKNIRIKHSGVYLLKMITTKTSTKRFNVTVSGSPVFGVETEEIKTMSEMAGNPVTLHTDVNKAHGDELILWRFGDKSALIAKYDMEDKNMPLQSPDERFRDRLQLNHQTGSLTITNTRITDSGLYKVEISSSREKSLKKFSVSISAPPLSSAAVAAIVVGVVVGVVGGLLLVAAVVFGVMYLLRGEMKTVFEGESAVLQIKILRYCCCRVFHIDQWLRNNQPIDDDERLKGRLEMDQTGSLTIKNSRTTDSGLYQAKITVCGCFSYFKMFNVGVWSEVKKHVKEGDSVTLVCKDCRIQTADEILWTAEPGDTIIAQYKRNTEEPLYTSDKRFKDRLKLIWKDQTGSLTITNISIKDSGLYTLKIRSGGVVTSLRRFSVFVGGEMREMNVMMGDPVTLNPDDHNLQDGDKILWYSDVFGTICLLAKVTRGDDKSGTYNDVDGRFKNRLNLDHQTGSLTITNTRITHTGEYRLLIISKNCSCKRFRVTVSGDVNRVSVEKGDSVTLNTETEIQRDDVIEWNYEYSLIAKMSQNNQAEYPEGDERFRGRLELDPQTGSLTITNFTYEYTGLYEVEIKSSGKTQYKNFSVSVLVTKWIPTYVLQDQESNYYYDHISVVTSGDSDINTENASTVIHMPGMTEETPDGRNESDYLLSNKVHDEKNHEESSF